MLQVEIVAPPKWGMTDGRSNYAAALTSAGMTLA
jgi:hypothetical protein